jgi:hypothetical protein
MSGLEDRLVEYKANAFNNVFGWVGGKAVDSLELSVNYQAEYGIKGDALEIGVFQGRFFLALASVIEPNEVAVALDIFSEQNLNVDNSGGPGKDLYDVFKKNVEDYAPDLSAIRVIAGDSMVARASDLIAMAPHEGYRLISVDGGHTAEHVVNDLLLASDIIVGGGVVFVDDWMGPHWPGVTEGYNRFMANLNRNLAPVLYTDNKLVMTTIGHQPALVNYMRDRFVPWPNQRIFEVSSHGFKFISAA